jgi:hypothetical protein
VLITGESGTGKDLVARAIHVGSPRSAAMFLPYNCTTTTRELADSQLFGHRRGSFTGAVHDQLGIIRSAGPARCSSTRSATCRSTCSRSCCGSSSRARSCRSARPPAGVDVRVLAATNADLEQRVADGKFREDLYYRLSVIRIHVPSLRERRDEIPHLSTFFLREACDAGQGPTCTCADTSICSHGTGGRATSAVAKRDSARGGDGPVGRTIEPEHLSADLSAPAGPGPAPPGGFPGAARSSPATFPTLSMLWSAN